MHAYNRERPNSQHGFFRQCIGGAFSIFAAVALAACGGGGGGGSDPPAPPAQNPPPANTAPSVNAGPDQTITSPARTATVTGTATDAENNTLTYAWTGDSGVTFASANSASTEVTLPGEGSFTLTLTVSDGTTTGSDTVVITVQPAASGNTPPTVDAGADAQIQLPTNQVELAGSATDAEGDTLTYAWTAEPNTVTFADAAAAATTATFPGAGTYTLTLTANDGAASGSDTVTVSVLAEGELFYPAPDTDENVPDRGWTRVAPADVGMDATKLVEAQAYAEPALGAGMIVKGGRLVHSWAVGDVNGVPVTIDTKFAAQSATKSIGGMALGLAMQDHGVTLADTAVSRLPSIGNPPGTDPADQLNAITISHLATHTAGFPKDAGYNALAVPPGSEWRYSDGGLNWLADVLTNVFQSDLQVLLTSRVWGPLGLNNGNVNNTDDIQWRNNASRPTPPLNAAAVPHRELASGMSINANAMARVGLLFLRNGAWANAQQILPQSFVAQVQTPVAAIAGLPVNFEPQNYPGAPANYGVLWWTNKQCTLPNVPKDAYWAWGQYDSLIVVIPSLDLVVSRIGPANPAVSGSRVFGEATWTAEYGVLAGLLDPIVASTGATGTICTP